MSIKVRGLAKVLVATFTLSIFMLDFQPQASQAHDLSAYDVKSVQRQNICKQSADNTPQTTSASPSGAIQSETSANQNPPEVSGYYEVCYTDDTVAGTVQSLSTLFVTVTEIVGITWGLCLLFVAFVRAPLKRLRAVLAFVHLILSLATIPGSVTWLVSEARDAYLLDGEMPNATWKIRRYYSNGSVSESILEPAQKT